MHSHPIAVIGDVVAGVAVLGSLAGFLPNIAALMAIVWYAVQLYTWWRKH